MRLRFAPALAAASGRVVAAVRRWLDLDAAPAAIDAALADLPGAPGLRLPGCVDGFELAVRAVLGQQVTVAAARTLACRLVERFGETGRHPLVRCRPRVSVAAALAAAPLDAIAELGIIRTRAAAIAALAQAWPELARALAAARRRPTADRAAAARCPASAPWTAHYVAMRALGWPDAFPPNDVAVLKAMSRLFRTASLRDVDARAHAWRPWRSYAVLRLWNTLGTPT